ncbi:MAG TPA: hypothetical protein VM425_02515 [Myxococcota bacterium]|nr:hypothetical protein [Myxococcota bacterium]
MKKVIVAGLSLLMLFAGCTKSKYDKLADASEADKKAAVELWNNYRAALGERDVGKDPVRLAHFFSGPLLASLTEADFSAHINKCLGRTRAGAFSNVKVVSLKNSADGFLMILDSRAGEAAIPLVRKGKWMKFSELSASTGDWTSEPKAGPTAMPRDKSLLYIMMVMKNEQAPITDRLRAAVGLAKKKYRRQIIANQKTVSNPIVRLGLGLARVKIDGSDESFIRNFPTAAAGLEALQQADKDIFEEMLVKLTNMGSMIEDPPANEVLYKVAAGAPDSMRLRMGKALYTLAEAGPPRFANAIRNVAKDMRADKSLKIYLEEVKRRGGKAPKMLKFLGKFSRIGEPAERKLCRELAAQINKSR